MRMVLYVRHDFDFSTPISYLSVDSWVAICIRALLVNTSGLRIGTS